jgi:hypothetical protein
MVSACVAVILLFTYFVALVTTNSAGCFAVVSVSLLSIYLKFLVTTNSVGFLTAASVSLLSTYLGISCDDEQCGLFRCGLCRTLAAVW